MKDLFSFIDPVQETRDFNAIKIRLASPEDILEWSHGEVKKPETINYRTFKPERDGLFCAKIFGPVKDFECNCGKYKRMKHRGVVCEKCGVEVISAKVRRERLGHIELASPVAHIWFLRSLPSRIGNILDIPLKQLESILYCEAYIVTDPLGSHLQKGDVLKEREYQDIEDQYGFGYIKAETGGEAIYELLSQVDISKLAMELREELRNETNDARRKKLAKRLKTVNAFKESKNKPEWMMVKILPVLPPDLRPLVPLDGGRFATSDLNDLYRRVINRNNRLKKLVELTAPAIIIRNEKRMLQEAVDALFDNGRRSKSVTGSNKRPLKSLSDMLKGKQGRFRQNLLGKRVDYSGRSVIVVGPELRLHQCGLPKKMALELFKPFIYHELQKQGLVTTIKMSKKMVENEQEVIWDILDKVIKEHPVLLNRAPTLHRLGIQAFEPVLIEGKAIQLHPLVCTAFNADFDGDQMAVHVPLSIEAQMEARVLMMSTNNILGPAHGKPIIVPTQDIVLGLYYVTRERPVAKGMYREKLPGVPFVGRYSSVAEVRMAYDHGALELHAPIMVRMHTYDESGQRVEKMIRTTCGRVLVYDLLPEGMPFELVNKVLDKKSLAKIIDTCYRLKGDKETVLLADHLRTFGYTYSTIAGISISIDDMHIPSKKKTLLAQADKELEIITQQESEGFLTSGEKHNKIVDLWSNVADEVASEMMKEIAKEQVYDPVTDTYLETNTLNPIFIMAESGARGSQQQLRQLAGMRGLMAKPSGEIIETPITTNFREGLSVHQYFISTHGARKGLADTALKTANSGYLTRRLVDVAQDAIVSQYDCGTSKGIELTKLTDGGRTIEELSERLLGRVVAEDIYDPYTDEIIAFANEEIDEEKAERIKSAGIERVRIRSVLTCESKRGVCVLCYGRDLARGHMVQVGEAVGIIAAQSIGEPGTQLTMRTFHIGGTAQLKGEQSSIEAQTKGIIRLERCQVAERVDPDTGEVKHVVLSRNSQLIILDEAGREKETHNLVYGAVLQVKDGDSVKPGDKLSFWDPYSEVFLTEVDGYVRYRDLEENITISEKIDEDTGLSQKMVIENKDTNLRPGIVICDDAGRPIVLDNNQPVEIRLPAKSYVLVENGKFVSRGEMLAKLPIETAKKTKDITGGLPRVVELFEARKPKEHAIISEIDGVVSLGPDMKNKQRVVITPPKGEPREYFVPKMKHIKVREGEFVHAGDALMEGPPNPHDILKVSGIEKLAQYLTEEVQQVYRVQGVSINDKHIEMIVRQMLRKVRVLEPNDTNFLIDEAVDKTIFEVENKRVMAEGRMPATAEPLLLGITKASLSTESFLSASSFQETTRVLTEASIWGRVDHLKGLKENVIIGRLLPAGTGFRAYHKLTMVKEDVSSVETIDEREDLSEI